MSYRPLSAWLPRCCSHLVQITVSHCQQLNGMVNNGTFKLTLQNKPSRLARHQAHFKFLKSKGRIGDSWGGRNPSTVFNICMCSSSIFFGMDREAVITVRFSVKIIFDRFFNADLLIMACASSYWFFFLDFEWRIFWYN